MPKITMVSISKHPQSYARGRNGYFQPHEVEVMEYPDRVSILVWSKKYGHTAPIMLSIKTEEAEQIADLMLGRKEDKA